MRISVELVPRARTDFETQLAALASLAPGLRIDTVNIPSAPRYGLDVVEAAGLAAAAGWRAIAHLRSRDFRERDVDGLAGRLARANVREALVVAGDPPPGGAAQAGTLTPEALLRILRRAAPQLRLYAAFDPNRSPQSRDLLARIDAKLAAGASGLFGQPLFEVARMHRWALALATRLPADAIWWGASPVLSTRGQQWWTRVNGVQFPADFAPTLDDWGQRLPALFTAAQDLGGHFYLMPIRAPLEDTLAPLPCAPSAQARASQERVLPR